MIFATPFIMHLLRSFSNASLLLHHHFDVFNLEHIFSNSHPLRLSSWIRLFLVLEGGKTRRQMSKQALILQTIYGLTAIAVTVLPLQTPGVFFFIYLFLYIFHFKVWNLFMHSKYASIWQQRLWELSVSTSLDIFNLGLRPRWRRFKVVDSGDPDGGAVVRSIKHDAEHTRHPSPPKPQPPTAQRVVT